jgi:oxaloacetate decarboxylase (Na+ extruding) subunit gamma
MAETLETGLLLLVVGMITVFTVLGIVVLTGKFLIAVVNRTGRLPNAQLVQQRHSLPSTPTHSHKRKIAAVVTAALIMTKGKGSIKRIQRVDDEQGN